MSKIAIGEITGKNWREALCLAVHPEQQRFVADVAPIAAIVLAKAYVRPGGLVWQPLAFFTDGVMIGVVALAYTPMSADDYWVYHFFIDRAVQGRGHGKRAMRQLIEKIAREHPRCRRLRLTVHPENSRAQALYTGLGFQSTDEEVHGEPVYGLTVHHLS